MKPPRNRYLKRLFVLVCLVFSIGVPAFVPASAAPQQSPRDTIDRLQPAPTQGAYSLRFHNFDANPRGVNVAIMHYNPDGRCKQYGGWETQGWWVLKWGQETTVLNTNNRHVYYYAYAADGSGDWSGNYRVLVDRNHRFDGCVGFTLRDRPTWQFVNMASVDMGPTPRTHTVNLNP